MEYKTNIKKNTLKDYLIILGRKCNKTLLYNPSFCSKA